MKKIALLGLLTIIVAACVQESGKKFTGKKPPAEDPFKDTYLQSKKMFGILPLEAISENNSITPEKVKLGKKLYFEKRLSLDNTQSCNTCHNLNTFGVDNNSFSAGNNGGLGGRNSPTTLNAALHFVQFWDGREPDVEAQAGGPILNPVEMEMPSEAAVVQRLSEIPEYQELFKKAFPNESNPITYENLKKSIGAFERKLLTPSRFDDYLAGNSEALTTKEKVGLKRFIEVGCATCHAGPLLGGDQYQKFGVHFNYWDYTKSKKVDEGRFEVTQNEDDKYVFKVPSLRNVEKTYPYFHDGSIQDLKQAVKIMAKTQLNKDLSDRETDQIVTFLKSLNGEVPAEFKQ